MKQEVSLSPGQHSEVVLMSEVCEPDHKSDEVPVACTDEVHVACTDEVHKKGESHEAVELANDA